MKLLVFAHVPPPHHGQAVMVELMLRGLRGKQPRIARSSRIEGKGRDVRPRASANVASGSLDGEPGSCGDSPSGGKWAHAEIRPPDAEVGQTRRCPSKGDSPLSTLDSRPSTHNSITVFHVNAQVSDDLEDVGGFRLEKLKRLLGFCWEAIALRLRHGPMDLYYVPAPAKKSAILRDWIVMLLVRPWFRRTIFHWHAFGLGHWATGTTEYPAGKGELQISQISQIDDKGRDVRPARPGNGEEEPLMNAMASRNSGGGFQEDKADCRATKDFAGEHGEKTSPTSELAEHDFARCTPAAGRPRQTALPPSSEQEFAKGDSDSRRLVEPGRLVSISGLKESAHAEIRPPALFGRFEGVARWVTRWLLGGADVSMVLTEYNRRDAELLKPKHIAVVPNGIPDPCPDFEESVLPVRRKRAEAGYPRPLRLLFLGHCMESKGLLTAVRILDGVRSVSGRDAVLTVAGKFPSQAEKAKFDSLVGELGVTEAVNYVGFADEEAKRPVVCGIRSPAISDAISYGDVWLGGCGGDGVWGSGPGIPLAGSSRVVATR